MFKNMYWSKYKSKNMDLQGSFLLWFYPCGNFIYLITDAPEGAVLFAT